MPADFRQRKCALALAILIAGMLLALVCCAFQGWVAGRGYPDNTFLFNPASAFTDLSDVTLSASRPNPYVDPTANYLPFTWLCFRPLNGLPPALVAIAYFFVGLGGLFLLLVKALERVIPHPPSRVLRALLLLGTAYPVAMAVDRGNIELLMVLMTAGAIYFLARARYVAALLCLVPAISLKLYPVLLLVFLVRQRKWLLGLGGLLASGLLTLLSLKLLSLPIGAAWQFYGRNMAFFTHHYIYETYSLEGSASPWNAGKVVLISLAKVGLVAPVDFSYDSSFVRTSYALYSAAMLLLALLLAIYFCLLEKEFLRGTLGFLLLMAISAPSGGDYRLLYAGVALVLLMILRTKRAHDTLILILLALTMVPKKEIFLVYAGRTETSFHDVSVQVVLNPLFILAALFFLLYDARTQLDLGWSRLRALRLVRSIWTRSLVKAR